MTDVNEAFAVERARQIDANRERWADTQQRMADGRLQSLGGNRYRVNDPGTWDNGEVITVANGQITPQHGLDMSTGQAALYTTVPAWHRLGNVIPGGITDIDQVLELGGINFEVVRRPVLFQNEVDGPALVMPEHFVTVRTDTGDPLGVVGRKYEVMQNADDFRLLQELVGRFDVTWESAGALRGGRRVFVSMRLPIDIKIDVEGVNDEIVPFIVAMNSHDGSSKFEVVATPWRPVCGNTERFAIRDAHTRWGVRHTANVRQRVDEARRHLGLSVSYYKAFADEEQTLARTDLAIDEFRRVVEEIWPLPDEPTARTRASHSARAEQLVKLYDQNATRLGRTAYAAERAVTEWLDWQSTVRPTGALRGKPTQARITRTMEGANDERKTRAHKALLRRVR